MTIDWRLLGLVPWLCEALKAYEGSGTLGSHGIVGWRLSSLLPWQVVVGIGYVLGFLESCC